MNDTTETITALDWSHAQTGEAVHFRPWRTTEAAPASFRRLRLGCVVLPRVAAICTPRPRNHLELERFRDSDATLNLRVVGSIPTRLTRIPTYSCNRFSANPSASPGRGVPAGVVRQAHFTLYHQVHGLRAGDVGTVVERHAVPGVPEDGYSVEFFDTTRNTVTVAALPASALRLSTWADRPAVRALSA